MTVEGGHLTSGPKNTLSPMPAPPGPVRHGYLWTNVGMGVVYVAAVVTLTWGFFDLPLYDPVGAGSWALVISLMIFLPAAIVLAILSCGVVYLLRRTIGQSWPGPLQALPAVVLVLGLTFLLLSWLFADDPATPY